MADIKEIEKAIYTFENNYKQDCKYLYIKDFVYGTCNKNMCGIIKPDDYCSHGQKAEK